MSKKIYNPSFLIGFRVTSYPLNAQTYTSVSNIIFTERIEFDRTSKEARVIANNLINGKTLGTLNDFGSVLTDFEVSTYNRSILLTNEIGVDYLDEMILDLTETQKFIEVDIDIINEKKSFLDFKAANKLEVKNLTKAYQKDSHYVITIDPRYVSGPSQGRPFYFTFKLNI